MSQVKGYECKHALYSAENTPKNVTPNHDIILIKEYVHYEDGSKEPNIRIVKDFKRPFWITKVAYRDHKEKKEWEDKDKLNYYETNQAQLPEAIKKALGLYTPRRGLRYLAQNPYLYGADITPTAIIKRHYMDKYPECISENEVAIIDIETDVIHGTDDPILISVTSKSRAICAVVDWFVKGIDNPEQAIKEHFEKRLPNIVKERGIDLEVYVGKTPLDLVEKTIGKCHEWKPDFLAAWNMNFDIPRILETIEKAGADASRIFSDPKVPKPFRRCYYKEGASKKVKADGKEEPLHWTDRWHTLRTPASFYVVDQACVFRRMRIASGKEPSYKLDSILNKYLGVGKLKNDKADEYKGLDWHVYMQKHEPLEYAAYNLFDCISCELLDESPNVGDLRLSISMQTGHSDYENFSSQPRRTVDDIHFLCLSLGKVIGTTSDEMKTEWDNKVVSRDDWIVTLPAYMVVDNGLRCIEESSNIQTMIRVGAYDSDVTSAYPTGEDILNGSRETTIAEVSKIEGVLNEHQRNASINLTGGPINASEICMQTMKAPTFEQLLKDIEKNGFCD